ncbi:hypothetical protein Bca4012_017246 [Brassica carinata]|uniref:KIB1-4 beta-propeller domain-containing protein n=1 Tax=Brassica carinata TaxID=52824 RepID=A0A8X7WPS8_BRACI|nr:hypothetical protein Bca52824_004290 [Brassica carinata]
MSLILSRLSKLCLGESRRSTRLLVSSAYSSSPIQKQTPPYTITGAEPCGEGFLGRLTVGYANQPGVVIQLEKKVPGELLYNDIFKTMVTIGSSHGWVATLKEDGLLRLQDDLNPSASCTDPKHIPLPPLVTLPHCQTQIVTNVSMSTSSPEDEDCVVAVKFLGPQLSFCRPAQRNSEWTNISVENPCFFSSRVIFSKKDEMFRMPCSGGQLIGSWDLRKEKLNIQRLQFKNLPVLAKTTRELLDSCCTIENLVESVTTGETFLVKQYKKTGEIIEGGVAKMKTEYVMVLKLDEEGNAVYTQDIGDLCIFLSRSEPFCVPATSLPGTDPNFVYIVDFDEFAYFNVADYTFGFSRNSQYSAPYYIPPQNI